VGRPTKLAQDVPFATEVQDALEVARAHLGASIAIVAEIDADAGTYVVQHVVAPPDTPLEVGDQFPLAETYCEITMRSDDVVAIADAASTHERHPAWGRFHLASYAGVALHPNGATFGTLSFSSPAARDGWSLAELGLLRLVGTWVERTLERRSLLARIEHSDARFRAVFEASPDAMVLHRAGAIAEVNPATASLLGVERDAIVGASIFDFLVREEDRAITRERFARMAGGEPAGAPLQVPLRTARGALRWVEALGMPVETSEGRLMLTIARDVTSKREELQQRMMRSDRLAAIGALAAGIAHELNNPLAYVMANVDVAIETLGEEEGDLVDALSEARQGAERAREIVRDLRVFSRVEASVRPCELQRLLDVAVKLAANDLRPKARVVKDYGPSVVVDVDEVRVTQVFVNLLLNTAQAMPEGDAARNEVRLTTSSSRLGWVEVVVADSGPGFPAEVLPHVFEPFFTTKAPGEGTGLGLPISRSTIEELGGTITAQNGSEGGAELRVSLPLSVERVEAPPRRSSIPAAGHRGRVLVVDDNPLVARAVERILSRYHDVVVALEGKEALSLLLDAGERFDVVVCDLMMPEVPGWDVHATLAERAPELAAKMIFMTGGSMHERARSFLESVDNPRFEKPFDVAQVRALVEAAVESTKA